VGGRGAQRRGDIYCAQGKGGLAMARNCQPREVVSSGSDMRQEEDERLGGRGVAGGESWELSTVEQSRLFANKTNSSATDSPLR
jgi:hypothetical protein